MRHDKVALTVAGSKNDLLFHLPSGLRDVGNTAATVLETPGCAAFHFAIVTKSWMNTGRAILHNLFQTERCKGDVKMRYFRRRLTFENTMD